MNDSSKKPLRADAQRNRRRILDAAAEVFAERGLEASLDQVAEKAGVGVGTVYRRFPDKETLIEELFESRLSEFVAIAEECAAMDDAWEGLTRFIAEGSLLQGKDMGLRELMLGPGGLDRKLAVRPKAILAPLVGDMVERAKKSGQLRPDFETLDVPVAEIMLSQVIDVTGEVAPDAWRRHLTMFVDGMRAENATPLPSPGLTPEEYTRALTKRAQS
jgi:AcrR family transcriptional regulator